MTNNLKLFQGLKKLLNIYDISAPQKYDNWFEFRIKIKKDGKTNNFHFCDSAFNLIGNDSQLGIMKILEGYSKNEPKETI